MRIEPIEIYADTTNAAVFRHPGRKFPGVLTVAEESTAWTGVSRPTYLGGLGFSLKWNMGWMNDTLRYMSKEPVHRRHHHGEFHHQGLIITE